jgi:hypothetical protein
MVAVDDSLHEVSTKHRVPDRLSDTKDGNYRPSSNSFPARLTAADNRDHYMHMKANAPEAFGQKFLSEEDLHWMERKRQNAQWAEFEQWCESKYACR